VGESRNRHRLCRRRGCHHDNPGGLAGGLSILGTTGIIVPYSCSPWIHSIRRGIDVARAAGLEHIADREGANSERAVQCLYDLPEHALSDSGDLVGGTLKYLRTHPVARLTIAGGGFTKPAADDLDLHSARSRVDAAALGWFTGDHPFARAEMVS
jgi:cobalt-precorrin-5B (C1)-methyltransferase